MTDEAAPPDDFDARCFAHVMEPKTCPPPTGAMTPVLGGAVRFVSRALAAHVAKEAIDAAKPDDGIRIEDLRRYRAEPGDVIVAWVPALCSEAKAAQIKRALQETFAGHAVLVSVGVGIEVVNAKGLSDALSAPVPPSPPAPDGA